MSHILIVEDETATAWALAESLRDDGYKTTTVVDAEGALKGLKGSTVDLVITDVRLPGMNGVRLIRRLRSARRRQPVIVITAYGTREVLDELEACGVHAVFSKPFRVDQLRRSVREALQQAASLAAGDRVRAGQGSGEE
jgi:two-component system response regulator (stage 0 sporulation protein F)